MAPIDTLVVTRTRNRPAFLRRAAESLCAQTHNAFAWVIVNDAGEREPVDAVLETLPETLKAEVIHLDENAGMEAAGNIGMRSRLGEGADYAALHDDDDRWAPDFLVRMTGALSSKPDLAGVVCEWQEILETEAGGAITPKSEGAAQSAGALTLPRLAVRNRFPPIALLFRKTAWEAAGGFNETLPVLGDWDFNLRLLLQGDLASLEETLAYQHVREQASGTTANSITGARDLHKAMRTHLINHHVRQDIEAGRPGLGALLAQADILEDGLARTSLKARVQRLLGRSGETAN
ncbi:glycosyltransferase family A protein [Henriciella aquimarina]|uniref:glycosyltransferase family A protein n=1 Tax=Henriciella aquimarina TaxID=545261 RepID=UPI0009FE39C1|nr:glycosyltransferase family A protein [Henriciella aquimarina]